MKFSDSFLDEIRARLSVSDVVSRRVQLKRRGREFVGLSPFQQEKTPSFTVNDEKGFYHCFSSGEHGDIFTFLTKTEGLSFPEAVERLAAESGLDLPKPNPQLERWERKRSSLFDVMEAACSYFESCLTDRAGELARAYTMGRNLTGETIREFRIGFAPPIRDGLKRTLTSQGISEEQLIECGLIIRPDDGRATYDRFRNRLIIPIADSKGRIIAFGGRVIDDDTQPKYLNSPETTLFKKGEMVFNFGRARKHAFDAGVVIVTEGYLDAIALHQANIKNVVATLGTAFTETQIRHLWQLSPEPIICFDGDRAGLRAANRAIDRIMPQLTVGQSFRFAFLPQGNDPDDMVREGKTSNFRSILEEAEPLANVFWRRETSGTNIDTPERKVALENRVQNYIKHIQNDQVRSQYRLTFRIRLGNLFWKSDRQYKSEPRKFIPQIDEAGRPLDRLVLGLLVEFPDLFEKHQERAAELPMASDYHSFLIELIRLLRLPEETHVATFYKKIDQRFFFILNAVHGDRDPKRGLVRGYRLYRHFGILKLRPPHDFVEACLLLFMEMLEQRGMRVDLNEALQEFEQSPNEETENRLLAIARDKGTRQSQISKSEHELDAWARDIHTMFRDDRRQSFLNGMAIDSEAEESESRMQRA